MSKIAKLGGTIVGPADDLPILRKGTVKRVHVNGHAVRSCARGQSTPCLTIQTSRGVYRCHEVRFHGRTDLIERIERPLKSGARIWLETRARLEVLR